MQCGTCLLLSTVTGMWLLPAYIVQKAERSTMEMFPVHHRTDTSLCEVNYENATWMSWGLKNPHITPLYLYTYLFEVYSSVKKNKGFSLSLSLQTHTYYTHTHFHRLLPVSMETVVSCFFPLGSDRLSWSQYICTHTHMHTHSPQSDEFFSFTRWACTTVTTWRCST